MRLEVISYNSIGNYHDCLGSDGSRHKVDLIVEGSLPQDFVDNPRALNGKCVEIGFLAPYIEIANDGVRVIE